LLEVKNNLGIMRRIKFLMLGMVLFVTSGLMAQDSTFFANEYVKSMALLRKAQSFNDADMEKRALFDLLVLNENDTTILQGLASKYYNEANYTSAVLVGLDYLKRYPGDVFALEICALSYEKLRIYDKAIQFYQDMYFRDDNVFILYQIAFLQYTVKRYDESIVNILALLNKADPNTTLQLSGSNNRQQEVSFEAALYNLRGLIEADKGNNTEAKGFFEQALKVSPDFEAALLSLKELDN
jgi:tetratricopeptide (TPR) repeat protein